MKNIFTTLILLIFSNLSYSQKSTFTPFIPEGYVVKDSLKCDLNLDGVSDYLLVFKDKNEEVISETLRPIFILEGIKGGGYRLAEKNDSIVLNKDEGGIWGDPYSRLIAKKNYFSIEHFGGSNWRWTRIFTFKYDLKTKKYILHKDGGISYHTSNPNKLENLTYNKKSWGKIEFKNYNPED
jgi:hypothetical protein